MVGTGKVIYCIIGIYSIYFARGDGLYELTKELPPGRHAYYFIVNKKICLDDSVDETEDLDDGSAHSVIKISKEYNYHFIIFLNSARKPVTPKQYTRVMFSVYAPVEAGVTISVCGDLWALGSFTPHDALRMYTTPDLYPIWKTKKPVVVSRDSPFKYRYLQFSGGIFQSYEFIDRPREFTPKIEHVYYIFLILNRIN